MADRTSKTIIYVPVFNRRETALESLHNMRMMRGGAHLRVIDDASTRHDGREMVSLGDSGEVHARNMGIDATRIENLVHFLSSDFDYCYFTDSDTLHDPQFLDRALQMFDASNAVSCLYNSCTPSHRNGFSVDIGNGIIITRSAPGVSMFFDKAIAGRLMTYYLDAIRFQPQIMKSYRGWDWFFCAALPHFAQSAVSYVEHMYADGLHVGNGRDVAMNPTPFLEMEGSRVFEKLGIPR